MSVPKGKLPLPQLAEMKQRGEKIVMVTAYDAPSARLADAAGVELILVGDSAAMVMLGHDSTVPASMDEMLMLTRAAVRGASRSSSASSRGRSRCSSSARARCTRGPGRGRSRV